MKTTIPLKLSPGDTIGIVSPGSPMATEKLANGIKYLEGLGYKIVQGENVHEKRGYLAGADKKRAEDINRMFDNSDIKAIFCSRGGYGSPRLLDLIDYDIIRQNPKIFVGYSDLTTLELAIWHKTGLVTFSGPMVAVEMAKGIDTYTAEQFWQTISKPNLKGQIHNPQGKKLNTLVGGKANGRLLGGCLSTITSLLGSRYLPDFRGALLFLEDIDEEPYRLDRYLAQFRICGILNEVSGIIFGDFIDCKSSDPEKPTLTLEEVLHDYTADLGIPVVSGLAYGHSDVKTTMPVGAKAMLDADNGLFEITEAVIAE